MTDREPPLNTPAWLAWNGRQIALGLAMIDGLDNAASDDDAGDLRYRMAPARREREYDAVREHGTLDRIGTGCSA